MTTDTSDSFDNGLIIADAQLGEGAEACSGQTVTVHYTGWLFKDGVRGAKFDSSKDRNDAFEFGLGEGRVIAGWDLGVRGMKVGGTRLLTIPPQLGYGARGAGGVIPPNATLQFEVELLAVSGEGLGIEDSVVGSGEVAASGAQVTVHYTGWLLENGGRGAKFDSSKDRNDPFEFTLGGRQVIAGWDMGVQGMKVGGTRVLTIPSRLGYGSRGAGGDIPPNATLIFEVELLSVS